MKKYLTLSLRKFISIDVETNGKSHVLQQSREPVVDLQNRLLEGEKYCKL